ncbi:unnamed protein product [Phaedon cochleariae]|uniref:PHD-type domain-containing protein n=1 Tax=Phaedon cochleariae TaxID=80249 RepID=A0A9N9X057_PHACE|nr:unnamed protein product [Phaedon cochleariae]
MPMCKICSQTISSRNSPGLQCQGRCQLFFHYKCVKLPATITDDLSADSGFFWKCADCRDSKATEGPDAMKVLLMKIDSMFKAIVDVEASQTEFAQSLQFYGNKIDDFNAQMETVKKVINTVDTMKQEIQHLNSEVSNLKDSKATEGPDAMKVLLTKIDSMFKAIVDVKASQTEFAQSLQFYGNKIDDFNAQMETVKKVINTVDTMKQEIQHLNSEVSNLKYDVEWLNQQGRLNNIEILGIPETTGKNLYNILDNIAGILEVPITKSDVTEIHRVQLNSEAAKKFPKPVIVKLNSQTIKNTVMQAARTHRRNLTLKNLNFRSEDPVYINEHLSPFFKTLLKKSRIFCKDNGFKFCWSQIRKIDRELTKIVRIGMSRTIDDLFHLVQQGNQELKTEIQNLKESLNNKIAVLKGENDQLIRENSELKQRISETEKKLKKYNLIVYGVQGDDQKTESEVINIVNDILKVKCNHRDFRDIYRIGKSVNGEVRPVVVEVVNFNLKTSILSSARSHGPELKKKNINFSHDYTKEEYTKRKLIHKYLVKARKNNLSAFIKNNILTIDGKEFSYEELLTQENETEQINNAGDTELITDKIEKKRKFQ